MGINIKGALREISSNKNISDQYDNTKTYSVGDLSIHGNTLFKCIVPIDTPEEFDSTKWEQTNIADELEPGFNVIYKSEMTDSDHFTQEQINIIANGKPTRVVGFLGKENPTILNVFDKGTSLQVLVSFSSRDKRGITYWEITKSDGYVNIRNNYIVMGTNTIALITDNDSDIGISIGGKKLPNYPPSTGTFVFKSVNGTLSYQEEWYGTQAQYDALGTYDSNTIYNIFEEE